MINKKERRQFVSSSFLFLKRQKNGAQRIFTTHYRGCSTTPAELCVFLLSVLLVGWNLARLGITSKKFACAPSLCRVPAVRTTFTPAHISADETRRTATTDTFDKSSINHRFVLFFEIFLPVYRSTPIRLIQFKLHDRCNPIEGGENFCSRNTKNRVNECRIVCCPIKPRLASRERVRKKKKIK